MDRMNRLLISGVVVALVAVALLIPHIGGTADAACGPAPSGLVSWWRAEGDYTDCQGANNGTQVGSVPFAAGKVGQAVSDSNNANNYVDLGDAPRLKLRE